MRVKVRRVGNSLTVTIPSDVVMEMGITEDTDMNVFVQEGSVVIEPVTSRWDRLVAGVRAQAAARGVNEKDVTEAIADLRPRDDNDSTSTKP
ncbi:MAG: AbrB/MazE/SpoVT family DNA-binding domain-containing protein [Coriobacteriia bacterium]